MHYKINITTNFRNYPGGVARLIKLEGGGGTRFFGGLGTCSPKNIFALGSLKRYFEHFQAGLLIT